MSTAVPLQKPTVKSPYATNTSHSGLLLQRKCACGSPKSSLTGKCKQCEGKTRLQAKLTVGASNDPLEQEADRVAEKVMRISVPETTEIRRQSGNSSIQRTCAPCSQEYAAAEKEKRTVRLSSLCPKCANEEKSKIQRKAESSMWIQRFTGQATGDADPAPASVDRVISGSGRPLDPAILQDMGRRFGHDFSQVRVHTGADAAQSARDVNAYAYTVGNNVVFGAGQFAPESHAGRKLIAHELTHVVQQGTKRVVSPTSLHISDSASPSEREANHAAHQETGAPDMDTEARAPSGPLRSGRGDGCTSCQSLSKMVESLLPIDNYGRASVMGKIFSEKAVGVDGNWLSANLGTGVPLKADIQSEMESVFGVDLSAVRVHTNENAGMVAQTLNARAVTVGQHIAFAGGQFNPNETSGRSLLIHELTHTIQQKNVSGVPSRIIPITRTAHSSEHEADTVTQLAANGQAGQLNQHLNPVSTPQVSRSVCGVIVEGACWASFSAIAAAIAALCVVGTTITIGGLAIPCTAVVIAAAGLAAWDAVMCTNILKEAICGEKI